MKVVHFKMATCRVNMCYSTRETVAWVQNEGSDLEDFSDSGSEENIVDSGKEFVSVDLEADSRDSDNNIFIFIIATSRIKNFFFFFNCLDSSHFAVATEKGIWYDSVDYLSDKYTIQAFWKCICLFIIPSSLFTTICFKRAKTVFLQELSVPFCDLLNELRSLTWLTYNARLRHHGGRCHCLWLWQHPHDAPSLQHHCWAGEPSLRDDNVPWCYSFIPVMGLRFIPVMGLSCGYFFIPLLGLLFHSCHVAVMWLLFHSCHGAVMWLLLHSCHGATPSFLSWGYSFIPVMGLSCGYFFIPLLGLLFHSCHVAVMWLLLHSCHGATPSFLSWGYSFIPVMGLHFIPVMGLHFIPVMGLHFIPVMGLHFIPVMGLLLHSCHGATPSFLSWGYSFIPVMGLHFIPVMGLHFIPVMGLLLHSCHGATLHSCHGATLHSCHGATPSFLSWGYSFIPVMGLLLHSCHGAVMRLLLHSSLGATLSFLSCGYSFIPVMVLLIDSCHGATLSFLSWGYSFIPVLGLLLPSFLSWGSTHADVKLKAPKGAQGCLLFPPPTPCLESQGCYLIPFS